VFDEGANTFGGPLLDVVVWLAVEGGTLPKSSSHGRMGYWLWFAEDPVVPELGPVGSANGSPQGDPTLSLSNNFVKFRLSAPNASNSEPKEAPKEGNVGSAWRGSWLIVIPPMSPGIEEDEIVA